LTGVRDVLRSVSALKYGQPATFTLALHDLLCVKSIRSAVAIVFPFVA
jgi:hypothetical protein